MTRKSGDGGGGPATGGRPTMLSPGLEFAGGGCIIPSDAGGGTEDGKKFRDLVWVPDDEKVWRAAKKVAGKECGSPRKTCGKYTGDSVWVNVPGQSVSIEVPKSRTHAYDPSHALDLDDASKMNQMHEAPLLDLLLRRFRKDAIYTNVADVLISVNPYKSIPLLYEVPLQQMQNEPNDEFEDSDGEREEPTDARGRGRGARDTRPTALRNKLAKPHVFSVADRAFRYMKYPGEEYTHGKQRGANQSIIISGESGAGKTEASKHVMRYLIAASQLAGGLSKDAAADGGLALPGGGTTAKRIEVTLLRSSTVLEAFGNAKTLRNDNSSRFGKYTKLLYNNEFRLMGAWTDHFLLEKSRIAKVDSGERGYHIFYQLLAGLDETTAERLLLAPPEEFFMISQGGCLTISDEIDDAQEFSQTDDAMGTLGFAEEHKAAVWRVLAALLHLSNVRFEETDSPSYGAAKAKVSMWNSGLSSSDSRGSSPDRRGKGLAKAAGMLGLDEETLTRKVTWRAIMAPGKSTHEIALTARESSDNLSALSKHTYGKLFSWIVAFINRCHHEHVDGLNKQSRASGHPPAPPGATSGATLDEGGDQLSFIGILDIFGFEIMATNSFEQLCINFANEVLQRQFNHQIFELEQEEYKAEGLDVAVIPFQNNEAIIDLICKRPLGLMIILEDQVLTGRKAHAMNKLGDRSILDLYHQEHHRRNPHPNYEKPRMQCDQFILKHFAGSVTYDVAGFLEKNNDSLQDDLRVLLLDSEDPFVRELAEINHLPEDHSHHQQRRGSSSNSSQTQSVPALSGVGFPPTTPPVGEQSQNQRRSSFSQGRMSRRGSERGCGLANATTVSNLFRRQLDSLVAQLGMTEPHYIKCIKPNSAKAPGGWSCPLVMEQLRYSGVLEVVRIRREAYPLRLAYLELYRRFRFLAGWSSGGTPFPDDCSEEMSRGLCGEICSSALDTEDFQMGKTRVFLKDDALEKLRWALQAKYVSAACCIQARWRAHEADIQRQKVRHAVLSVQAAVRGLVARRHFKRIRASLLLHAMARGFLARRRCGRALRQRAELRAREIDRKAEEFRQKREAAHDRLASIARAVMERERLHRETCGATVLQVCWRGYNARKALETSRSARRSLEGRRATELQAWARMLLAGQAHSRARRASTTLASAWRMRSEVMTKKKAISDVITLQALYRGVVARRWYAVEVCRIVRIQKVLRCFVKRTVFVRQVLSVRRLQQCVRSWLRNARLRKSVMGVFGAARRGDAREVTKHITEFPQLLFIRDRYAAYGGDCDRGGGTSSAKPSRCFSTLLHAACESGAMDVVALLEPFPEDVTAVDLNGNCSVHVAASAGDYELVKHLSKRNNIDVTKALREEKNRSDHAQRLSRRQVGASVNVFLAARLERAKWVAERGVRESAATRESNGDGCLPQAKHALMSGYLRKRRETDRWLKRWCVLTETTLMYFHKPTDESPSKIIQLDKAMLKKSDKVDFAFEIHTPDLLDKKNKEGRLHFACTGEGELQKWLVPLRVVVALYQFRNDKRREPLVYLDIENRARLVSMRNKRGETPLHVLAGASMRNSADSAGLGRPSSRVVGLATLSGRSSVVSMQRLAAWLVESGADANQLDNSGQTALHVGMECGNFSVVSTLARKGGDVNIKRRSDGRSVITQALEEGQGVDIIELVSSARVTADNPLLPPPEKLFGFTYVSFFIEKTTFPARKHNAVIELTTPKSQTTMTRGVFDFQAADRREGQGSGGARAGSPGELRGSPNKTLNPKSAISKWGTRIGHVVGAGVGAGGAGTIGGAGMGGWDSDRDCPPPLGSMTIDRVVEQLYFVRISVYNAKGNLCEPQQDVTVPIITTPEYLWWAQTWHMQTPLETLGAGSFIAFELKEKGERKERTISWGVYHLNPDEVNTRAESLCAYAGVPPTLLRLEPSEFSLGGDAIITKFKGVPVNASVGTTATAGADAATSSARAGSPANSNAG